MALEGEARRRSLAAPALTGQHDPHGATRPPIFSLDEDTARSVHDDFQHGVEALSFLFHFAVKGGVAYGAHRLFGVIVGVETTSWVVEIVKVLDVLFVSALASMLVTESVDTFAMTARGFWYRMRKWW
jgi:hypothetical protein